jgi:hypothetical protein
LISNGQLSRGSGYISILLSQNIQELKLLSHVFHSGSRLKILSTILFLIVALPIVSLNFMTNDTGLIHQAGAQTPEEKLYVLLFEQNKVGNIDNSTKIVSAIVGHNLIKIEEELMEELSLAPSQELEVQVGQIISNGTSGSRCNLSLVTQDGQDVAIDCISSGNHVIWHVYPK